MNAPEELGGTETKIAEVVTASELTTSNWGDEKMFFRHERMENDLAFHPEWEPLPAVASEHGRLLIHFS